PEAPLPNFVVVGTPGLKQDNLKVTVPGSGYLGARHQPFIPTVAGGAVGLQNLQPLASDFDDRVSPHEELQRDFAPPPRCSAAEAHQTTLARTVQLIRSGKGKAAFDLSQEPAELVATYGDSGFGRNCLLARRLVDAGVAFVEISLPTWDTHDDK